MTAGCWVTTCLTHAMPFFGAKKAIAKEGCDSIEDVHIQDSIEIYCSHEKVKVRQNRIRLK